MRIDFHMYFNKYVREINAHFIFQNLIKSGIFWCYSVDIFGTILGNNPK